MSLIFPNGHEIKYGEGSSKIKEMLLDGESIAKVYVYRLRLVGTLVI